MADQLSDLLKSDNPASECRRKLVEGQGLERQIRLQLETDKAALGLEAISLNVARSRTLYLWAFIWFLAAFAAPAKRRRKK